MGNPATITKPQTKSNEEIIEEVVTEYVKDREAFTAYDITLACRRKGMPGRHLAVKQIIHETIDAVCNLLEDEEDILYMRTLIDVGADVEPWLYHHEEFEITDYKPLKRDDRDNITVDDTVNTVRVDTGSDDELILSICTKNRLYMGKDACEKLGFEPGDQIYIVEDGGDYHLQTDPIMCSGSPCYTIEKHGGVRVQNMNPVHQWKLDIPIKKIRPM